MSILVTDCSRCGAENMTFDVSAELFYKSQYSWQRWYELFCIFRNCRRSTVFIVSQKNAGDENSFREDGALLGFQGSLNPYMRVEVYVSLQHRAGKAPPDHVPPNIQAAFREAATCLAVEC